MSPERQARFWPHVDVRGKDECWPWKGERNRSGYGVFFLSRESGRRERTSAHRVSLEISLGRPLSKNEVACHKCDNPPCVNPAHLWAGTHGDNARDRSQKGRTASGSRSGGAKLTEDVVAQILSGLTGTHKQVGQMFGVSESTIGLIRRRRIWKHVERMAA